MDMQKHDKADKIGFNVDPEQLAHDLAILKLSKMSSLTENTATVLIYEEYVKICKDFRDLIDDKMRYDSSFDS
ncbi:MAG: hypothetical protein FWC08_13370 [Defluviitaleaceae bacterium]|nr:hypothetical protein [Defluviitaleaceae bacterium]